MKNDRIERALRTPGPREQGYEPSALPLTAADARRGLADRSRLTLAGAFQLGAWAVATGLVIAFLLSRGTAPNVGNPGPGPASATATPSQTATHSASPVPLAACRAGDFAWSSDLWGGAAGSRGTNVLLRAVTSAPACEIRGKARLVIRDANGRALITTNGGGSAVVSVKAGTLLEIGIAWSNWCGSDPARPLSASLTMPGDATEVPLATPPGAGGTLPPCNGPGQPSTLSVTDFQYSTRTPPSG